LPWTIVGTFGTVKVLLPLYQVNKCILSISMTQKTETGISKNVSYAYCSDMHFKY
jgi:hypothetical protein